MLIRIDILIPLTKGIIVAEESEVPGGLPRRFESISRIPAFHVVNINDFQIAIGRSELDPTSFGLDKRYEFMKLSVRLTASNFPEAIEVSKETIELVFDHLSFQIQQDLHPYTLDLTDVTPPVKVGDVRNCTSVTAPGSILMPKYFTSQVDLSISLSTEFKPSLNGIRNSLNRNDQLALWWYIKSISSSFLVDKVSFLFIVIDNISKPHITGPYRTNCNHEISNCPICNSSIEKVLVGESIKQFLVKNGFTAAEANTLWGIRQIVHGRDLFSYKKMQRVSTLIGRLKLIVFNELKKRLGLNEENFPKVELGTGPVLSQNIFLDGTREIDAEDIKLENDIDSFKN